MDKDVNDYRICLTKLTCKRNFAGRLGHKLAILNRQGVRIIRCPHDICSVILFLLIERGCCHLRNTDTFAFEQLQAVLVRSNFGNRWEYGNLNISGKSHILHFNR
ncbi:hypothetical protein D3C81_1399710 [compost metagenome]